MDMTTFESGTQFVLETNLAEKDVEKQRESFMTFIDSLRVRQLYR